MTHSNQTFTKEELFNLIIENPNNARYILIKSKELNNELLKAQKGYKLPEPILIQDLNNKCKYGLLKMFFEDKF